MPRSLSTVNFRNKFWPPWESNCFTMIAMCTVYDPFDYLFTNFCLILLGVQSSLSKVTENTKTFWDTLWFKEIQKFWRQTCSLNFAKIKIQSDRYTQWLDRIICINCRLFAKKIWKQKTQEVGSFSTFLKELISICIFSWEITEKIFDLITWLKVFNLYLDEKGILVNFNAQVITVYLCCFLGFQVTEATQW